jgi:tRNA U34 2-thiouridine synthase MnmA/TrmU
MNRKAIALLSGGLDSTLATKVILDEGIEVVGLHFAMRGKSSEMEAFPYIVGIIM